MKKTKTYTQCELRQKTQEGYLKKVCWIPTYGAIQDNVITLEDVEGDWTVIHVGGTLPAEMIENQAHNSKTIWTATSGPCPRGNK